MNKLLREPLIHFLLLGGLFYVGYGLFFQADEIAQSDDARIEVNRHVLINFMQYRAKMFEPDYFEKAFDGLSDQERTALIDDYLQDEVLYREARKLGLEEADYVIRQRLIQKQTYLLQDVDETAVGEDALAEYFTTFQERYQVPASVTFTHVFFSSSLRGKDKALADAKNVLAGFLEHLPNASDAPQSGDRFPYFTNYVERTRDYIQSHLGVQVADTLFGEAEVGERWVGPVESPFGYHLLLRLNYTPERVPELDEVRTRVLTDYIEERQLTQLQQRVSELKSGYRVDINLDGKHDEK